MESKVFFKVRKNKKFIFLEFMQEIYIYTYLSIYIHVLVHRTLNIVISMRDNNNMSNDESAISFLRSLAPQRFRQLLQHTRFESCIVPPLIRVRPIPTKPMRSLHATTVATTASKFELEEAMSKLLSP